MKHSSIVLINLILIPLIFALKINVYFICAIAIIFNTAMHFMQRMKSKDIKTLFDGKEFEVFNFTINLWFAIFSYKICGDNIIYFALCFILFDVIFILYNKIENIFITSRIIKYNLIDQYRRFNKYIRHDFKDFIIDDISESIKEYKENLEKEQERLSEEHVDIKQLNMDNYVKVFNKLHDYPYSTNPVPNEKYEKILKKVDFLDKQIKMQEKLLDCVNITRFEIYTDELITFMNSCIKLDLEKNNDYMDKMNNILETYERYLDGLLENIEGQLKMDIDVNYQVLANLMEREK